MSPKRWHPATRAWVYRYLVLRDGEQCARCGTTPGVRNSSLSRHHAEAPGVLYSPPTRHNPEAPGVLYSSLSRHNPQAPGVLYAPPTVHNTLDIHHLDGHPTNNNPDNLQLLCHRCNTTVANQNRAARRRRCDPCVYVCERERMEGRPETRIAKEDCNYREASPEMQANTLFEVPFRRWLMHQVTTQGGYDRTAAINEEAERVGCSPTTTARYLAKLTSPSGPLVETHDALGHKILVLKGHLQIPPHEP